MKLKIYRNVFAGPNNPVRFVINPRSDGDGGFEAIGYDLRTKKRFIGLSKSEQKKYGRETIFEHVTTIDVPLPSFDELDSLYAEMFQPCGHPLSAIAGEGTSHCSMCEQEARDE